MKINHVIPVTCSCTGDVSAGQSSKGLGSKEAASEAQPDQ